MPYTRDDSSSPEPSGTYAPTDDTRTNVQATKCHQHILTGTSAYNSTGSINSLPNEILSMILSLVWKRRTSFRVAHVCQRWRAIALKTPQLLLDALSRETFEFDESPLGQKQLEYVLALLEHCSYGRLRLHFSHFPEVVVDRLQPHLSRITALDVNLFSEDELLRLYRVLNAKLPSLEKLRITFEDDQRWEPDDEDYQGGDDDDYEFWFEEWDVPEEFDHISSASFPVLKTLSVPGLLFPFFACQTLENVEVQPVWRNNTGPDLTRIPSANHLHQSLMKCGRLKTLTISQSLPEDITAETWPTQANVVLPTLQSAFFNDTFEYTSAALTMVKLPPHIPLRIQGRSLLDEIRAAPQKTQDLVLERLQNVDRVEIGSSEDCRSNTSIQCNTSNGATCLRLDMDTPWVCLDITFPFRHIASITHLTFKTLASGLFTSYQYFFRAFPNLISLELSCVHSENLLEALTIPDDPENAQSLVCSQLRTLTVSFPISRVHDLNAALVSEEPSEKLAAHLRTRLELLLETLKHRVSLGSRLTKLEWSESYTPRTRITPSPEMQAETVQVVMPVDGAPGAIDFGMNTLQQYVDGPVTFEGFFYIPSDLDLWP